MARLKVLQIVSGVAIGEQSGGAEQFAARLALGLTEAKFERGVFVMWRYGGPAEAAWLERLDRAGVRVAGLIKPAGRPWADLLRAHQALWEFSNEWRPNIANSHSERGDVFNASLRLLHPAHPASVRTMHTDQQWQERPWAGPVLIGGFFPLVFAREIAISEQTRERLDRRALARLLRKRALLCYNGIEANWFERRETQPCANVPTGRPALIVVGRLAEQKGHSDLLKALARIREKVDAHLWIVGTGPLEDRLRNEAATLGLEGATHFLGSRKDISELLVAADVMVSSSLWEGFPTVVLEAMAMDLPVVATEVSGSRELVLPNETGLLAPPGRPAALAEAILTMLGNPSRAERMARAAREHAKSYTIENTITRYAAIYEGLR